VAARQSDVAVVFAAELEGEGYDHVRVTNTGKRAGARQLKGFEKVMLKPGQSQTVSFTLDKEHLSVWDEGERVWKLVPGTYSVHIGSSSRDLRAKGSFLIRAR
jgi:fibronectin type III domain protein